MAESRAEDKLQWPRGVMMVIKQRLRCDELCAEGACEGMKWTSA